MKKNIKTITNHFLTKIIIILNLILFIGCQNNSGTNPTNNAIAEYAQLLGSWGWRPGSSSITYLFSEQGTNKSVKFTYSRPSPNLIISSTFNNINYSNNKIVGEIFTNNGSGNLISTGFWGAIFVMDLFPGIEIRLTQVGSHPEATRPGSTPIYYSNKASAEAIRKPSECTRTSDCYTYTKQ